MKRLFFSGLILFLVLSRQASACDLCAIYSADSARGQSSAGFIFTAAEQFVPYRDLQFNGEPVSLNDPEYVDSSMTHVVVGYNFHQRFGLSLNTPIIYRSYKLFTLQGPQQGTVSGLGDMALIGRWTVFQKIKMKYAIVVNLLGGVKFPTGDTDFLKDENDQARLYNSFFPPGHAHGVLAPISGVHPHDLALGSGSFDGIIGTTLNSRWQRYFFNAQFQYYLRTEGEAAFRYGDDLMVSGGPGGYVFLNQKFTLSLQANAVYETMARDTVLGQKSDQTGMTAWYLGPQLGLTWKEHLSVQAGVDLPIHIQNNGLQSVPEYRIHGSLTWRF